MGFCTKCGKQVNEGDRFCFYCGAPLPEMKQKPEQTKTEEEREPEQRKVSEEQEAAKPKVAEEQEPVQVKTSEECGPEQKKTSEGQRGQEELGKQEVPVMPKRVQLSKKTWMLIGGIAAVLILIVGVIFAANSGKDKTVYASYTNEQVFFTVDYPEDYSLTEPENNNVLIADGETTDFQVVVEYAYYTVANSAIYSAEDMANQIEADNTVLTDWIGTTDMELTSNQKTTVASMDCYEYCFALQVEEKDFTGQMYIFDSMSDCGCYVYTSIINENASKAKLYKKQNEAMKESLRIVGECMPEGYQVYRYEDLGLQFMIRDEAMGETKDSGGNVVIYPTDGVFTESSIWLSKLSDKASESGVEKALESDCSYYFKHKKNAQYTTQPAELNYGRYPCTEIEVQYYDDGQKFTYMCFVIQTSDGWWCVSAKTTDAYYDTTVTAATDLLFSIRFDGAIASAAENDAGATSDAAMDTSASTETSNTADVSDIIAQIESSSGYVANSNAQGLVADMNQDGTEDFMAIYTVKNAEGKTDVMYEVWTLPSSGAKKLQSGVVYTQVGGNSGSVGVVERYDNVRYFRVLRNEPSGDQINKYCTYSEWPSNSEEISDSGYYLEAHATVGDEGNGRYILGDQNVDYNTYQQRWEEFTDYVYKVDLLTAPSGDVKSFDELR